MRTVVPVPRGDHLPLRAARFSLLVRRTGGIATPHVNSSISPCVCHPPPLHERCLHTRRFGTLASPPPPVDALPWRPHPHGGLPIRQEILNVPQIGIAFHRICAPFFHPDMIATVPQTYLLSLCALLSQQSHLFLICVVWTCNDSRRDLHKLCRSPRSCQCK